MIRDVSPIILAFVLLLPSPAQPYSGGPPDGVSGGPGEDTCVMCHSTFGLNSGPGMLTIAGPPSYEPGQTYPVTVTLQQAGQTRWGFEFSPLDQGTCTIIDPTQTQLSLSGGRTYVKHTVAGTNAGTPGPTAWTFNWTAPTDPPASITFYAAGNAANNDGGNSGDYIYTATHSMGLVPVELIRFDATLEGRVVMLRWVTLSECDNAGFRVYRAQDDEFQLISPDLIPGAGTSVVRHSYVFEDVAARPGGQYSYRLADVTSRGRETVCGRTSLTVPGSDRGLEVHPSVIHGEAVLHIRATDCERIEVLDLSGRIVLGTAADALGAEVSWDLRDSSGRRIPPGVYVCRASPGIDTAVEPFVVLN